MANQFKLDTNDVLGLNYQKYCEKIKSLALSKPSEYFDLRQEVLEKVKADAVGNLYNTLFAVLSEGKDLAGNPIGKLGTEKFVPCYPSQKINDFALGAATDMAEWINDAIDIILPDDFEKIAMGKLRLKGKGSSIEVAAP